MESRQLHSREKCRLSWVYEQWDCGEPPAIAVILVFFDHDGAIIPAQANIPILFIIN
jgi:hypothetical protein